MQARWWNRLGRAGVQAAVPRPLQIVLAVLSLASTASAKEAGLKPFPANEAESGRDAEPALPVATSAGAPPGALSPSAGRRRGRPPRAQPT